MSDLERLLGLQQTKNQTQGACLDNLARLQQGYVIMVGHRALQMCSDCGKIVRINKPFLGSMHLCSEERAEQERQARESR